jgi:3-oxoacyl-[acyl-carrier-protein] synthase-3
MSIFSIANIELKGVSAAVPKISTSNYNLPNDDEDELKKLIETIGIVNRREASANICASDLCISAAEKLINELNWKKEEIQILVFVTQTPDYLIPGTSFHIKERLGLDKNCVVFDLNQGCAGYVYGLAMISAFMNSIQFAKGLLLVGDTITKLIQENDLSLKPIFSDCGTATALCFNKEAKPMHFNLTSNGELFESIIVEKGGARQPIKRDERMLLKMKGLEVFNFSITKVVTNIIELLAQFNLSDKNIDIGVFHQANALILNAIAKKINLELKKVPSSLKEFGNTSGASIPLTMVTQSQYFNQRKNENILLCGFGVGLSIGSVLLFSNDIIFCDLIELE